MCWTGYRLPKPDLYHPDDRGQEPCSYRRRSRTEVWKLHILHHHIHKGMHLYVESHQRATWLHGRHRYHHDSIPERPECTIRAEWHRRISLVAVQQYWCSKPRKRNHCDRRHDPIRLSLHLQLELKTMSMHRESVAGRNLDS